MMIGEVSRRVVAFSCVLLASAGAAAEVADDLAARGRATVETGLLSAGLAVQWELTRLVSGEGEPERYEAVSDPEKVGVAVAPQTRRLHDDAVELRFQLTNQSDERLWLKGEARLRVPGPSYQWWNGYDDQERGEFGPDDGLLAKWFPINAALYAEKGLAVGLGTNPHQIYSRVDSSRVEQPGNRNDELTLAYPCVLDPGQSFEMVYVVTAFTARFGFRDAVQHYYDLFPDAYQPKDDIDPRAISVELSYLAYHPSHYKLSELAATDMIRRLTGGVGGWDWCYAAMARGGDWATTYEGTEGWENTYTKSGRRGTWDRKRIDAYRESMTRTFERLDAMNAAPMYFVNVKYVEKTFIEERYPGVIFGRREKPGVWGQMGVISTYTGWNDYGRYFKRSLELIPEHYPMVSGIAYDSVFGHEEVWPETDGVLETPYRTFHRGKIYTLEGPATAALLDHSREQYAEGQRLTNAVNIKLLSPYYIGARTDTSLYEGSPMQRPERIGRLEYMRARLGTGKPLVWHKHLSPKFIQWVEWDRMSPEEMRNAYRQLHDDTLLLNYFWGSMSAPMLPTIGMARPFRATPELIELTRLGWQPSPRATLKNGIPVRYGKGVGANLILINPSYETRRMVLDVHAGDWDGWVPLLARHDGEPLRSTLLMAAGSGGVQSEIEVPARDVARLVVVGRVKPSDDIAGAVVVETTSSRGEDGRVSWKYTITGKLEEPDWQVEFMGLPEASAAEVTMAGGSQSFEGREPFALNWNTTTWPVDWQSPDEDVRSMRVYVDYFPEIRQMIAAEQLAELDLPSKLIADGAGVAVVASPELAPAAGKVADWFEAYTGYDREAGVRPAIGDADGSGYAIRLRVAPDVEITHGGRATIQAADGDAALEVVAKDASSLDRAVNRLLLLLDEAYPHVGYVGGHPERDPYFEKMGLDGKAFDPSEPPVHAVGPTLEERLRKAKLIP